MIPPAEPTLVLPGDPVSIPLARQWLRTLLVRCGADVDAIEAAAAALSEVVDNAVEHARAPLRVSVSMRPDAVRCEVADPSPVLPLTVAPDDEAADRGGLELVAALSSRWGVEPVEGDGKVVWFEV